MGGFGQIVGPTFAGFLRDQYGSFVAPSLAAAVALCVAGALVLTRLTALQSTAPVSRCRPERG